MTRTKKQTHNDGERAALILELFRQLPDNKFSLRHLASASGGATKEGRRETMQIVEPNCSPKASSRAAPTKSTA